VQTTARQKRTGKETGAEFLDTKRAYFTDWEGGKGKPPQAGPEPRGTRGIRLSLRKLKLRGKRGGEKEKKKRRSSPDKTQLEKSKKEKGEPVDDLNYNAKRKPVYPYRLKGKNARKQRASRR